MVSFVLIAPNNPHRDDMNTISYNLQKDMLERRAENKNKKKDKLWDGALASPAC